LNTDVKDSNACGDYAAINASDASNLDSTNNTCWTFPGGGGVMSLLSQYSQEFEYGVQPVNASRITVTDSGTPSVTTGNGLRIAIATSSINMRWDTSGTPTYGGTMSGRVGSNISYEGGGSVLYIPVTQNFAGNGTLTLSNLRFTSLNAVTNAVAGLKIFKDGVTDQTGDATDSKTVTIKGTLTLSAADTLATNVLDTTGTSVVAARMFTFKLRPNGEDANISRVQFTLNGVKNISTGNVSSVLMYIDYNGDGVLNGGDQQVGGAGTVDIGGVNSGTLTFSTAFTATTSRNYIVIATIASLGNAPEMGIDLLSNNITATGATTGLSIRTIGGVPQVSHRKLTVVSPGGGAADLGGNPQGQSVTSGAQNNATGNGGGQTIGNEPGYMGPSATGVVYDLFTAPNFGYSSDDSYASCSTNYARESYYNFNFAIPAGNTITGVEVRLEAKGSTAAGNIGAALTWNGTSATTTPDKTSSTMTTSDAVYTIGSASDTWGRSWSASEFANGNFRLTLICNRNNNTIYIDAIQVKVYSQTGGASGGGGGGEVYVPGKLKMLADAWKNISSLLTHSVAASVISSF
jgi:hypothetical protein